MKKVDQKICREIKCRYGNCIFHNRLDSSLKGICYEYKILDDVLCCYLCNNKENTCQCYPPEELGILFLLKRGIILNSLKSSSSNVAVRKKNILNSVSGE